VASAGRVVEEDAGRARGALDGRTARGRAVGGPDGVRAEDDGRERADCGERDARGSRDRAQIRCVTASKQAHQDEQRHRDQLPDLDTDVEQHDADPEPVVRQPEILQSRRQTEAVDEPEREHHRAHDTQVRRPAAKALDTHHHEAERDHDIHHGGMELPTRERRDEQREAVADGEQRISFAAERTLPASSTTPVMNSR